MDIYKEILESFSRIHNRDLRLLEQQDLEAVTLANQALDQVPAPGQAPIAVSTPSGKALYVWNNDDGVAMFATNPNKSYAQPIRKNWDNFVGHFGSATDPNLPQEGAGEGEEGSQVDSPEEEQQMEIVPPLTPGDVDFIGKQQLMLSQTGLSEDTIRSVEKDFRNIFGLKKDIWKIMGKWEKSKEEGENYIPGPIKDTKWDKLIGAAHYGNYFYGDSTWSFQRALLSPKFSLSMQDGLWVSQEEPLEEAQTSLISRSFRDLVDVIVKDSKEALTPDECKNVLSNFAVTNRGDVVVKGSGDASRGLSFDGGAGRGAFIKDLLDKATSICKKADPSYELATMTVRPPITGTGSTNNVRGVAMEQILTVASLALLRGKDGSLPEPLMMLRAQMVSTISQKLIKAKIDSEGWVSRTVEAGIDVDTKELARELYEVLGEGEASKSLFESMLKHSAESLRVRSPKYALSVGDQVGRGKRQDVLELYNDLDEAKIAAQKSGLEVEPYSMPIEEAFGDKHLEELDALIAAGVYSPGQEVSVLKVSLKNYMSLNTAKYGGGAANTFAGKDGLMRQSYTKESLLKTISSNLQMSRSDRTAVKGYFDELDKIATAAFDLPTEAIVTTKDGKKINTKDTPKTFSKSILDKLRSLGYDTSPGLLTDLEKNARKIIKGTGTKYELRAAFDSLKNQTVTLLQADRVANDLKSEDPTVRRSAQLQIAHKMFHAGGSDDNQLVCDYRDLIGSKNYVFKQNDPLRDAWRSVLNGEIDQMGNSWDLTVNSTTGQAELSSGNMKITLKNEFVLSKAGDTGKIKGHHTNFSLEVNRAVMEMYNRKSIKENLNQELGFLLSRMGTLLEKMEVSY